MTGQTILAYSGGLDTTVVIPYLKGVTSGEIVAISTDTGQGGENMGSVHQRALDAGVIKAVIVGAKDEFAEEYCLPTIKANGSYMKRYPLVSTLSRPLIVEHMVRAVEESGGTRVVHGCTGKGSDQVRFKVGFTNTAPDLKIITPARDFIQIRDKIITFTEEKDLLIEQPKSSPFFIDQNLFGRAIRTGHLEDLWNTPTKGVYVHAEDPTLNFSSPDEVIISSEDGKPTTIDGKKVSALKVIEEMNHRVSAQGTGHLDMVEDRPVDIRSHEIYEALGVIVIMVIHATLEDVTVERRLTRYKRQVGGGRADLVYDGLWFLSLKHTLDTFIEGSQKGTSGDIRMVIHAGHHNVNGRRSNTSLHNFDLATYGKGDPFDQTLARGSVELHSLSSKTAARRGLNL